MDFQIIDWYASDINAITEELLPNRDDDPIDSETENEEAEYQVIVFGRTKEGKTISVKLRKFKPYFYIKCPAKWSNNQCTNLFYTIKRKNKHRQEVLKCKLVYAYEFYGFTNKQKFRYLKLTFQTKRAFNRAIGYLRYNHSEVKLYESNLDPLLRLIHHQELKACGVAQVSNYKESKEKQTHCDIEVQTKWRNIKPVDDDTLYPIKIASFDIECSSIDRKSFPKAVRSEDDIERIRETGIEISNEYVGDQVTQIGITTSLHGSNEIVEKHIICLRKTDDIKGATVESYDTEHEVLLAFTKYIQKLDPDIITGYNIFGFDFNFLQQRAEVLGCLDLFSLFSRIKNKKANFIRQQLSSSALGSNQWTYFNMEGRVIIDTMTVVRRDHKLINYRLDTVAYHFLKRNKLDVTPQQIFEKFDGTSMDRKEVAVYCLMDCELCNLLIDKLDILTNNLGMGNVSKVPLSYIFLRGQSIKIFSLVADECRKEGYKIPVLSVKRNMTDEEKADESYEGACVLDPMSGYYKDDPITVCDFSSLYPSCMIAENLSQDTWVNDKKYDNLPGFEYRDKTYLDNKNRTQRCRFVQPKTQDNKDRGILPNILIRLLAERKKTKKKMKEEKDPFKKRILNGHQLALKVTCNSVYGQTGAYVSPIYLRHIAGATAAEGRLLLLFSKNYVEQNYEGTICVYGDSILGDEPVIIKQDEIKIMRIKDLCNNWIDYGEKEIGYVDALVWSHTGWNKIKKVIRHKVTKKIYQVDTGVGSVCCTEDHSLLDPELNKIKPVDATELLYHSLPEVSVKKEYSREDILEFAGSWLNKN